MGAHDLPEVAAEGLVTPWSLGMVDGGLYVLDRGTDGVYEVVDGAAVLVADGLDTASDMTTDGVDLLVTDSGTGEVLLVDVTESRNLDAGHPCKEPGVTAATAPRSDDAYPNGPASSRCPPREL